MIKKKNKYIIIMIVILATVALSGCLGTSIGENLTNKEEINEKLDEWTYGYLRGSKGWFYGCLDFKDIKYKIIEDSSTTISKTYESIEQYYLDIYTNPYWGTNYDREDNMEIIQFEVNNRIISISQETATVAGQLFMRIEELQSDGSKITITKKYSMTFALIKTGSTWKIKSVTFAKIS